MESINTFYLSIAFGVTSRPAFTHTRNTENGELSVQMLDTNQVKPTKVSLWYAQTLSKKRRDFRWYFQINERTEACVSPFEPASPGMCHAKINWQEQELQEASPGVYSSLPPQPTDGYWMGYYIMVTFPGDVPGGIAPSVYRSTTPAWTWPDTLPYEDCTGAGCKGILV